LIMPELPYVEKTRLKIHNRCVNKQIVQVEVAEDNLVFRVKPSIFAEKMTKRTILDTHRKGKYFWLKMDKGPCPTFHLGMTGSVKFKDEVKENVDDGSQSDESVSAKDESSEGSKEEKDDDFEEFKKKRKKLTKCQPKQFGHHPIGNVLSYLTTEPKWLY